MTPSESAPPRSTTAPRPLPPPRPLRLMQVVVAMTLLAAVAMVGIPMHQRYLKQRLSQDASRDLSALQRQIQSYLAELPQVDDSALPVPSPAIAVATPTGTVTTTVSLMQQFYARGWHPTAAEGFEFGAAFNDGGYTLSANGRQGQACRLSLVVTNATREAATQTLRAARGADCGFTTW